MSRTAIFRLPKGQGPSVQLDDAFLRAVGSLSPYIRDLMARHPGVVSNCMTDTPETVLSNLQITLASARFGNDAEAMAHLRAAKQQAALVVALADLSGHWKADRVGQALADFADTAVETALRYLLQQDVQRGRLNATDGSNGCGIVVLAMGKHGAGELNYSSDIDLIVLIDPDAEAVPDRDEAVAVFVRMTKALVRLLQDRTGDGYVFRTDLRLRPDPGSMPIAIPVTLALSYYEARGQNWERAAMIKARPVAGDLALGTHFLDELKPYIWRRYLDFAAIADIHAIKRQIQAHRDYGGMNVAGHNVKLGRGGIREIEFFVQTQQLIAGGRTPALRGRSTLPMLDALAEQGWITRETADELRESYCTLRDVEHRLQMVRDEQTHTVPEARSDIAALAGQPSVAAFDKLLLHHLRRVEGHYAALFERSDALGDSDGNLSFTDPEPDPDTLQTLARMGFAQPAQAVKIVRGWHFGRAPAMQSADARARLTEMTPALLRAVAERGRAQETLGAFDTFIENLPAGFQLFHLLHANPKLLSLLMLVLSAAPRMADVVTRRPHVFDGMLEPGFFETLPQRSELEAGVGRVLALARDHEDALDRARSFAAEQRFAIGIRVLAGGLPAREAGPLYAQLAEVMLTAMLALCEAEFALRHGRIASARCCVLAMGNFGSRELTASSDLDLIVIYDDADPDAHSDGERPLPLAQYFGRLTQRFIAAMSAPTSQGILYELDLRLRPSGKSGPIATSLSAFVRYHSTDAWTWEHMALSRARAVAGDDGLMEAVGAEVNRLAGQVRDPKKLASEVADMRKLMDEDRAGAGPWDVKLAPGGLVDLEFLAQFAVLAGRVPPGGTTGETLADAYGGAADMNGLVVALELQQNIQQIVRLCLAGPFNARTAPRGLADMMSAALGAPDLKVAEATLLAIQADVRRRFGAILRAG